MKSEFCQSAFFTIIYVAVFAKRLYQNEEKPRNVLQTLKNETPEVYQFINNTMMLFYVQLSIYTVAMCGALRPKTLKIFHIINTLLVMVSIVITIMGI